MRSEVFGFVGRQPGVRWGLGGAALQGRAEGWRIGKARTLRSRLGVWGSGCLICFFLLPHLCSFQFSRLLLRFLHMYHLFSLISALPNSVFSWGFRVTPHSLENPGKSFRAHFRSSVLLPLMVFNYSYCWSLVHIMVASSVKVSRYATKKCN